MDVHNPRSPPVTSPSARRSEVKSIRLHWPCNYCEPGCLSNMHMECTYAHLKDRLSFRITPLYCSMGGKISWNEARVAVTWQWKSGGFPLLSPNDRAGQRANFSKRQKLSMHSGVKLSRNKGGNYWFGQGGRSKRSISDL